MTCLDCGAEIDTLFAYQYLTDTGFMRRPICETCYTCVVTGADVTWVKPGQVAEIAALKPSEPSKRALEALDRRRPQP